MAAPPRLIGTGTGHLASGSVPDAAASGYTHRLLGGGNPLTRWSHRNRYDRTIAFCGAGPFADALDWGRGDGWFLRALHERGIVAGGLGVDFDPEMLPPAGPPTRSWRSPRRTPSTGWRTVSTW